MAVTGLRQTRVSLAEMESKAVVAVVVDIMRLATEVMGAAVVVA
jgi:hypothetical protein